MGRSSPMPELKDVIRHRSPERLHQALRRITTLFLDGASRFNDDHLRLFDDVLGVLVEEVETRARVELSHRLAPVANAPVEVVRRLARDDDASVAGPMLERSPRLAEADLLDVARIKSQAHLMAVSNRTGVPEGVSDVLVRRGGRDVVRSLAQNRSAQFSEGGFAALLAQTKDDAVLAEAIQLRPDIAPNLSQVLPLKSEFPAKCGSRDYTAARVTVDALNRQGKLDETKIIEFARTGRYEEIVATLAQLCAVPIEVVDRLLGGERPDPVLVLCKSAGWAWPTTKAVLTVRPGSKGSGLEEACSDFERISPATAQRVMRFWQDRKRGNRPQWRPLV